MADIVEEMLVLAFNVIILGTAWWVLLRCIEKCFDIMIKNKQLESEDCLLSSLPVKPHDCKWKYYEKSGFRYRECKICNKRQMHFGRFPSDDWHNIEG